MSSKQFPRNGYEIVEKVVTIGFIDPEMLDIFIARPFLTLRPKKLLGNFISSHKIHPALCGTCDSTLFFYEKIKT